MNRLLLLLRHRGFLQPTAELYASQSTTSRGLTDWGPLGTELKRNLQQTWWRTLVHGRPDCVGMDGAVLGPSALWEASGHVRQFHDELVDCRLSGGRFRVDHGRPIADLLLSMDGTDGKSNENELKWLPLMAEDAAQAKMWMRILVDQGFVPRDARIRRDGQKLLLPTRFTTKTEDEKQESWLEFVGESGQVTRWPYRGYVHPDSNSPFLTEPRSFNLMFKTQLGSAAAPAIGSSVNQHRHHGHMDMLAWARSHVDKTGQWPNEALVQQWLSERASSANNQQESSTDQQQQNVVYLRPETAQNIFVNFHHCQRALGMRIPFGVAQVGKAFRNEIRPEHAIYRMAEFEQMELEWFCKPGEADRWFEYWTGERLRWWQQFLNDPSAVRLRVHEQDELAHYAKSCTDIEYRFPFGWGEVEGVANRTDFDLRQHSQHSGQSLEYFDDSGLVHNQKGERYFPYVIESSAGLSRACLAVLADAFCEETRRSASGEPVKRTVLKLHPRLAPIKVAIMPLLTRREDLVQKSEDIWARLRERGIFSRMDAAGRSIGKRYARHDEIGTPYCVTVDVDTLTDGKVTLRDRNTAEQERIFIEEVVDRVQDKLKD